MKYIAPLVVFLTLLGFLYVGLHKDPREVPSPLVGKPAPEFELTRVRTPDQTFSRSDLLGKVSLVNVWASWCASCRDEHSLLLRISAKGLLPIYGLNYKDTKAHAVGWLDQLGDPYTASGHDPNGRVGLDLGVYGVPETFLIDRKGRIAYKHIGPITQGVWENELYPRVQALKKAG